MINAVAVVQQLHLLNEFLNERRIVFEIAFTKAFHRQEDCLGSCNEDLIVKAENCEMIEHNVI